jgi:hypothetical protein
MRGVRRRLRVAVTAWLLFQVVSLSALVPLDCCDAHKPASAVRGERCHESADSPHCPLRAKTGRACPMHQQAQAPENDGHRVHAQLRQPVADEHASHDPSDQCAMGGTCSAPMTALAVILASHGIVPAEAGIPEDARRTFPSFQHDQHLTSRLAVPDSPPPRT